MIRVALYARYSSDNQHKDLEVMIGTHTRIAEVLARKRGLSIAMIRRLHEKLGIPAEVLIQPSRKGEAA